MDDEIRLPPANPGSPEETPGGKPTPAPRPKNGKRPARPAKPRPAKPRPAKPTAQGTPPDADSLVDVNQVVAEIPPEALKSQLSEDAAGLELFNAASLILSLLDGMAQMALGPAAEMLPHEKKLIQAPLEKLLKRADLQVLNTLNSWADPVLLGVGLFAWLRRITAKPAIAPPPAGDGEGEEKRGPSVDSPARAPTVPPGGPPQNRQDEAAPAPDMITSGFMSGVISEV